VLDMSNINDKISASVDKLDTKLDKIVDRLGSVDVTLAQQHESLKTHIRRTELLEEAVAPIEKHVDMMSGALKLVGILGLIAGILEGLSITLEFLGK